MTNTEIISHIDHTLLKATASLDDIRKISYEASEYNTASVCIPSSFVPYIHKQFPNLNICTVIGFPLGNASLSSKIEESETAIKQGANELDIVINIGFLKSGFYQDIVNEISSIKHNTNNHILKIIVETCYLTRDEKINMCKCLNNTDANYIKTSTGFGTDGANIKDIELFKKYLNPNIKIKASGGIKTKQEAIDMLNAGANRLGSSSLLYELI